MDYYLYNGMLGWAAAVFAAYFVILAAIYVASVIGIVIAARKLDTPLWGLAFVPFCSGPYLQYMAATPGERRDGNVRPLGDFAVPLVLWVMAPYILLLLNIVPGIGTLAFFACLVVVRVIAYQRVFAQLKGVDIFANEFLIHAVVALIPVVGYVMLLVFALGDSSAPRNGAYQGSWRDAGPADSAGFSGSGSAGERFVDSEVVGGSSDSGPAPEAGNGTQSGSGAARFCPNCGRPVEPGMNFCSGCGKQLS